MVYLFHRYSSGYGSEAMRQRYADEEKMFIPKLASVFTKMSMDAQTAESENDRKDRLVRRRSTLRLLAELLVAGVYTDGSIRIRPQPCRYLVMINLASTDLEARGDVRTLIPAKSSRRAE